MSYTLPPLTAGKIDYTHFPNRLCCFVFRNWELVEPSALASVVGAGENDIISLAEQMGLPVPSARIDRRLASAMSGVGSLPAPRMNW